MKYWGMTKNHVIIWASHDQILHPSVQMDIYVKFGEIDHSCHWCRRINIQPRDKPVWKATINYSLVQNSSIQFNSFFFFLRILKKETTLELYTVLKCELIHRRKNPWQMHNILLQFELSLLKNTVSSWKKYEQKIDTSYFYANWFLQ